MKATNKEKLLVPLSQIVTIPPKSYPSTNIEHDDVTLLENYLPSASTLEIIERFSAGLRGAKSGRMLSITGPYGSGKSTMAAFLMGLLAPKKSKEWKTAHNILKREPSNYEHTLTYARRKANIHEKGMIRCAVTARREPISVTLLRAVNDGLEKYFGRHYTKRDFRSANLLRMHMRNLKNNKVPDAASLLDLIEGVTRVSPTVIIIDEFGKNIEYFSADESQQSDLFLLQELAERSGKDRRIPLSVMTLQHMAFEEYAVGTSAAQRQEWAKIQGRFEDIPFANSPDQTRLLVSSTIKRNGNTSHARDVMRWAKKESKAMQDLGIGTGSDPALVASCYPLNPLALEVLPELCARYGQHERTLLSFISDSQRHTVATFIDEQHWDPRSPPTIGLDALYDYFISGTSMIHSSSANISRLMEVETIIRDAHGLSDAEKKTLKTIGILNLIGRSGYLRASRRIIDYAIGRGSQQVLDTLEKKSIITYRTHADEYRIWHGTDIDIAAKLDMYRRRYQRTSLSRLLMETIHLEPIVAAKHSIKTGTMRLFERGFALQPEDVSNENHDGVILYRLDDSALPASEKPIITVTASDTADLRTAATEVCAIRDMLKSDDDVPTDWVARKEVEERLADAEAVLDREFANSYGDAATWSYQKDGGQIRLRGKPSTMASQVCNTAYRHTPVIRNEMINRTALSSQGATAKRRLLEAMITRTKEPRFGIDGHGPERAIYEAVIYNNGIHVSDTSRSWLQDPKNERMRPVWQAMSDKIKGSRNRIVLADVYRVAKMPPYGVKDGPVQLLIIAMILIHKDSIALYEHGTFVPKLRPDVAERMTKNPEHFELKYFKSTPTKKTVLERVCGDLDTASSGSVLDVVGHLVRTVSALPPHIKSTKRFDKHTLAVRDAILSAVEPDTLLFESLPNALGYRSDMSQAQIKRFSKTLASSVDTLQNGLAKIFDDICQLLFDGTGIDDRTNLSKAAKKMEPDVTDQKMKVFLAAISADTLERRDDWINYVAMSLTDIPPTDWKDEHRDMFESNLHVMSAKFKRLAGIHFSAISGSFIKPSYQVTVTHADGSEHHNVVSLRPGQKAKIKKLADKILKDMKTKGFTNKDLDALIAMLSSESRG